MSWNIPETENGMELTTMELTPLHLPHVMIDKSNYEFIVTCMGAIHVSTRS